MSLFDELKTSTEHVRERCFRLPWRAADWRCVVQWNEEAGQEQRSLARQVTCEESSNELGGGEAKRDTADANVMDLVSQLQLKLSVELESRVRDLLRSGPTNERHRERDARRRQVLQRHGGIQPEMERRSTDSCFFNAMLRESQ